MTTKHTCVDCGEKFESENDFASSCKKCLDKFYHIMIALDKEMAKEISAQEKKDALVLEKVKKMLSAEHFKLLEEEIAESQGRSHFSIVTSPKGDKSGSTVGYDVWVNQTTNGGHCGDDFAGDCYFKLPNGKFFTWHYEM